MSNEFTDSEFYDPDTTDALAEARGLGAPGNPTSLIERLRCRVSTLDMVDGGRDCILNTVELLVSEREEAADTIADLETEVERLKIYLRVCQQVGATYLPDKPDRQVHDMITILGDERDKLRDQLVKTHRLMLTAQVHSNIEIILEANAAAFKDLQEFMEANEIGYAADEADS